MKEIDKIFEDWDEEEFINKELYEGCFVTLDPNHKVYQLSNNKDMTGIIKTIDYNKTYPIKVKWKHNNNEIYLYLKEELKIIE